MKYSIIISPNNKDSSAIEHAQGFITALLKTKSYHENFTVHVFLYGYAVKYAFEDNIIFDKINNEGVKISACSTIAESYLEKSMKPVSNIKLAGLGQWMESTIEADKNIEFV